jgi:membrane associated rhomboid family serine protease
MFEEFKSAFNKYNNAHVQLIIINLVAFVVMALLYVIAKWTRLDEMFAVVYEQFSIPRDFGVFITRPWTIVTYSFTHSLSDILHILFNMVGLYWFGRLFVEYLGSDKLIALYVLGGLAGAFLYLFVFNVLPTPDFLADSPRGMVGASASIFAIMTATAVLLPNYSFYLLFLGPVKIKYIAAVYIFISILGSVGSNAGGDIAHIGGALIGYVYMKQLQAGSNWGMWITTTLEWIKSLFKPRQNVKVSYRKDKNTAEKPGKGEKNYTQDEIDDILDKISAGGYESLTREEKEKLFNASKNK